MSRTQIMSPGRVAQTLRRLAYEVVERNRGAADVELFGIRTRGTALAHALSTQITQVVNRPFEVHELDVSAFRDDLERPAPRPEPRGPDITDRDVILVDDVLFTGRTVRAALDAIIQYGRPRSIQLVVLIDRGHREYPIQPDYVGRTIPTKHRERVVVEVGAAPAVFVEE